MKKSSHIRDWLVWTRKKGGGSKADYYAEVFDRWMRLHGPEIAMAPVSPLGAGFRVDGYMLMNSIDHDQGVTRAARRIAEVIPHFSTEEAFWRSVGARGNGDWCIKVYIRGKVYAIWKKPEFRRFCELYMLYSIVSAPSVVSDAMAGVGRMMEGFQDGK